MNSVFKDIYPRQVWVNKDCGQIKNQPMIQDERFGGFLVPFIAGAAISAPFWLIAGSNKAQQNYYPYPPAQYQYYPVYTNGYPIRPMGK